MTETAAPSAHAPSVSVPPAAAEAPSAARPPHVPEKFWDARAGAVRLEALLKSYLELEKRLGAASPPVAPPAAARLPETAEGYCIACDHGLFGPDPEINARLHAAGFTPDQAQLLYDLAAERLVPLLGEMAAEFQAERELDRLVARFGGPEGWAAVSQQILAWAGRNLPAPVVAALAGTADGVLALHRMMTGAEPAALPGGGTGAGDAADLHRMVGDPRYWRDRDPGFIAQVTEGFRRAYGS
ncbi:capsid assembly protein [Rhodospirillum centenum]|uniref:Uncharacterized protein n=1 Tax=Rhodospirillum centenum (strain ATCC 51521 / SW) TaxID=414684 RepID=B6IWK9_RHOCS|nr:hypothetical protein [Rhodospirillum centenum]ACJ00683.1 conserved hypothetical protein [Rhodospirillum centenum SW]